jgi:hypothetical protein
LRTPHLDACRLHRHNVVLVVRADLHRSVDLGVVVHHPATSAAPAVRAVHHPATSAAPAVRAVHHPATSAARVGRTVHRPATSAADPMDPAVGPVTSADPAVPVTSADPTTTIGDHRGTRVITTGAVGSTVRRGVATCRPGAGVRHRHRRGMDRCRKRGGRRRRRSTIGASMSNPCGIRVTTNGVSTSSGSGFHSRSDGQPGETAASDDPGRSSTLHLSE